MQKTSIIHIKIAALKECLQKYRNRLIKSGGSLEITNVLLEMEDELVHKYPEVDIEPLSVACMNIREALIYIADKTADLFDHSIVYAMYSK